MVGIAYPEQYRDRSVAYYEVRNFLRVAARDRLRFSDELLELLADQRQRAARPTPSWEVALEHCLEELSEANRGLLRRMYAAGESAQEIAAAMGREVQTVYNRVSLLRRKLARCVKDQLATEGALS